MFIDSNLEFADDVDITNAVATGVKKGTARDVRPNVTDNATVDFQSGEQLYLVVEITEAVTSAGSASVQFLLTTADNEALSTNPENIWYSGAIGKDDLVVGKRFIASLPTADYKRWLGIRVTTGTATTTAGKINAFITKDVTNWTSTATRVPATDPAS